MKVGLKLASVCLVIVSCISLECRREEPRESALSKVEYVINWDMTAWDPSTSYDNTSVALSNIYEPLLWYKGGSSKAEIVPALAESYNVSKDGLTWRFQLRKGVKFHDGSLFRSSDVKASVERTVAMNQGASWIWKPLNTIRIIGDHEIEFRLKYPAPLDLIVSSGFGAWITCQKHAASRNSDWFMKGKECGTGPYVLKKWEPGQQIILEYFPDYWRGWTGEKFKIAIIRTVGEVSTQIQMIRTGQADIVRQVPFEILKNMEKDPALRVVKYPSFESVVALLNCRKKPTDDRNVRRALAYAVDYEGIISKLLMGYGSKPSGPVAKTLWGSLEQPIPFLHAPRVADSLFSAAKHRKNELSLRLSFAAGDELLTNIALTLQSSLRKIGVDLDLEVYPWSIQWDRAKHLETAPNIFLFYWWPTYPTPYEPLLGMFHSEQEPVYNLSYYSNKKFDSLIDEAHSITGTNRSKAAESFKQAQLQLLNDLPAIFIADLERVYVTQRRVGGFDPNPAYANVVFFYELNL